MNILRAIVPGHFRWLLPAVFIAVSAGCASHTKVDWNSRIGTYTLDNAVLELGPPDKQARLQDGMVVAEWLTRHGYAYPYPSIGYPWYYGPFYPPYYYPESYYWSPNYYLRLIFGSDSRLQSWKEFAK